MKKAILILLTAVLFLCLSGPVFCEGTGAPDFKFEGDGFDTPEEGVLAFIDAWNRGDVPAAVSTFAIESLVDHRDTEYILENTRLFNPGQNYLVIPAGSEWIRGLEISKRYAEVSSYFFSQYTSNITGGSVSPGGKYTQLKTLEEIDSLLASLDSHLMDSWIGNIRLMEWIDPLSIQKLASPSYLRNLTIQSDLYGADDIMVLIAHLSLGDLQGILTMECLCYGGRWFNFRTYGIPASIFNLEPTTGGLYVFPPEEAGQLTSMYLSEPDPEAEEVLQSHLESSLTGTRWILIKAASGSEHLTAVGQIGDLSGWDREEIGIWSELHFTRLGCTFHTVQSDFAAGEKIPRRPYSMWSEDSGIITFGGDIYGKGITVNDQLMITTDDGMILYFEKSGD